MRILVLIVGFCSIGAGLFFLGYHYKALQEKPLLVRHPSASASTRQSPSTSPTKAKPKPISPRQPKIIDNSPSKPMVARVTSLPQERILSGPKAKKNCEDWLARYKKQRLLLSQSLRARLIQQSNGAADIVLARQHKAINHRYRKVFEVVEALRGCFRRRYKRLRSWRARQRLLLQVETTLRQILDRVTLPLWLGTPWAFYGASEAPYQKKIACGYFVVHGLTSAGFRFPQNHVVRFRGDSAMRIFEFAKLPASKMIWITSKRKLIYATSRKPIKRLWRPLKKYGPGIYILGLDYHVGLVIYDGKEAVFWHSSFEEPKAWVRRENLFVSPVVLASKYRMIGKVQLSMYRNWIFNKPIMVKKEWRHP